MIEYGMLLIRIILLFLGTLTVLQAHSIMITRENTSESNSFLSLLASKDTLQLRVFHENEYQMLIIPSSHSFPNLKSAINQTDCDMGINGGFFTNTPQLTPTGLLIVHGTTIHQLSYQGFTSVGILYQTNKTLQLKRRTRLNPIPNDIIHAVQSGPFLIENSSPIKGLNAVKRDSRTFIATDGKGMWCIGVSSPLTLQELANWLSNAESGMPFRIKTALNLDGGSSSAYYDKFSGIYIPHIKQVHHYIGFKRKKNTYKPL